MKINYTCYLCSLAANRAKISCRIAIARITLAANPTSRSRSARTASSPKLNPPDFVLLLIRLLFLKLSLVILCLGCFRPNFRFSSRQLGHSLNFLAFKLPFDSLHQLPLIFLEEHISQYFASFVAIFTTFFCKAPTVNIVNETTISVTDDIEAADPLAESL